MLQWEKLTAGSKAIAVLVVAATIAVGVRGIYAFANTDHLSDWITTGLFLGIPAGWAWISYQHRHRDFR